MPSNPNRKILIAEPSAPFRSLYHAIFQREGFGVEDVETPQALFAKLSPKNVDVLLLDPSFFGKEGYSNIKKITEHFPANKVVIYTSVENPEWMGIANAKGVAEYLVKGQVNPINLVSRVEELVDWAIEQDETLLLAC